MLCQPRILTLRMTLSRRSKRSQATQQTRCGISSGMPCWICAFWTSSTMRLFSAILVNLQTSLRARSRICGLIILVIHYSCLKRCFHRIWKVALTGGKLEKSGRRLYLIFCLLSWSGHTLIKSFSLHLPRKPSLAALRPVPYLRHPQSSFRIVLLRSWSFQNSQPKLYLSSLCQLPPL